MKLNFKLNTRDQNVGKRDMTIEIVKIYITQDGRKLHIYYKYDSNDATLTGDMMNYEVVVPLNPAYDGFCISGGPIQNLGAHLAPPWDWWKQAALDTKSMPDEITLTPMRGPKGNKTEMGRKADMLNAWKKAWSKHLVEVWGGTYPNMTESTTWTPGFATSIKAVEKVPSKAKTVFLFTTFVKNKDDIDRTAAFLDYAAKADAKYKLRLKF